MKHSAYALCGGIIYTCNRNNDVISEGTILILNDKIEAVLTSTDSLPEGYELIDLHGKVVTPGFIDSHTHQGLFDGTVGDMGFDGNEATDPTTPMIRAIDGINIEDPAFQEAVIGGVTTIQTGPGSANVIGGECAILKTFASEKKIDSYILMAPSALKAALGENPKRVYGRDKKMPSTRMGIAALFRKAFLDAQVYKSKWDEYNFKKEQYRDNCDPEKRPTPPDRDLAKETLVKVLDRKIPITIHCHQHNDIITAIRLAEEFNLRLILIHATEGHKIADFIAERHVPVSIGPSLVGFEKSELRNISFETPAILWKAGVKIALQSDLFTRLRYFQLLPCMAAKAGLPVEEALRAVTIYPAQILSIDEITGSIEKGKDADIVVWSGHPIKNFYAEPEITFVNGQIAYQHLK